MNSSSVYKQNLILLALKTFMEKGIRATNPAVKEFLEKNGCDESLSNEEIIRKIDSLIGQLSPLKEDELEQLKNILEPILPSDELKLPELIHSMVDEKKPKNRWEIGNRLSLTGLFSEDAKYQAEYDFILNKTQSPQQNKYLLESIEYLNGYTVKFSNFVFGNFHIQDIKKLESLFTRDKVVNALLTSLGYMTSDTPQCSTNLMHSILKNMHRRQPNHVFFRADGCKLAVMKVGNVIVSVPGKATQKKLDQYLIYSVGSKNATLFLSYGEIHFDWLDNHPFYEYNVANQLLSQKNLLSSQYIGTIFDSSDSSVVKEPFPFGKPNFKVLSSAQYLF